jgi:hypothetical protein
MKYLITPILTLMLFPVEVFGSTSIIYVDLSAKSVSIEKTQSKILTLIERQERNDFTLFISNGTNPYVCRSITEVNEAFQSVKKRGIRPQQPNRQFDLDTLNQIIVSQDLFKNFNSNSVETTKDLNFYFFFSSKQSMIYNYPEKIVKDLLLSNRLYEQGRLSGNCSASIYMSCSKENQEDCKAYCKRLKKNYSSYGIIQY